jgi:DNA invertase Pin-like site-specific DNA recombinase
MMFQMCGVFAEFERSILQERVKAGLERARAQGKTLGRPKVPPILVDKIKSLRQQGLSYPVIARRTGVSVGKAHAIVMSA